MSIERATETDLLAIQRLFRYARYHYADIGLEDLPSLIKRSESVVGKLDGVIWGFLGLQSEKRPSTLPSDAPDRVYLRTLALRGAYPPSHYVSSLLHEAVDRLQPRKQPIQIITYGGDKWLFSSLKATGFTIADQVQFYELTRPYRQLHQLPPHRSSATLLPCESQQLDVLAEMDAAAFPPLWHFGRKDMLELLVRARLRIAITEDDIVGYSAVIDNSKDELQLARLAVHPLHQGHGIGRLLMYDMIEYATRHRHSRIVLNTQTNNARSQRLYRSFGFRPMGKPVPVMTFDLAQTEPQEKAQAEL